MNKKTQELPKVEDLSSSMEDYLERIYMAQLDKGVVRVKDISKLMNVRMPSVNNAVSMLKKHNLVTHEPYGYIEITEEGVAMAERILKKHQILTKILISLGVPADIAEKDACNMEHVISDITFGKVKEFYKKNLK